jgi:hypothetical protein
MFKSVAYEILLREQKPMSAKELTDIGLMEGLLTTKGKTPDATMGAEIYKDIIQQGDSSPFVKVDKGIFGLKDWEATSEIEKSISEKDSGEYSEIIEQLSLTQFKSDSPNDFESAIRDAFVYLGFEGELIGGSGDSDVLLTANIGQESYKISVDGKTSKSGKVIGSQIDWLSLADPKKKNKANFIVVVGASFAGGNLLERALQNSVSLLRTEDLINLVQAHENFPFSLFELQDLFAGKGEIANQVEDLLSQNSQKRRLLEQFRVIIEEMQSLQDWLGYFTFDSLAGRERIEELDINPKDIEYIISLLMLPFVNGIKEITPEKYILAIRIRDISNIFHQISNLLVEPELEETLEEIPVSEPLEKAPEQKEVSKYASKYFRWYRSGNSIVAEARPDNPYKHHCPVEHFKTILDIISEAFNLQNIVYVDAIMELLKDRDLSPNRPFKGRTEDYKIRMTLGILEIEEIIKWTGSKRPIEYILKVEPNGIEEWYQTRIVSN